MRQNRASTLFAIFTMPTAEKSSLTFHSLIQIQQRTPSPMSHNVRISCYESCSALVDKYTASLQSSVRRCWLAMQALLCKPDQQRLCCLEYNLQQGRRTRSAISGGSLSIVNSKSREGILLVRCMSCLAAVCSKILSKSL